MSKHRRSGKLFVISGPSGTGKGTLCKKLAEGRDIEISISMTTRDPRPGERDGKEYFFVSREEFGRSAAAGNLLESANVFGNMYGTPKDAVMKKIERGRDVILEIDVQGGLQVREAMPEHTVLIFLLPPSMVALRERLTGREAGPDDSIERRLGAAVNEMKLVGEYDYCVYNDDLDEAVSDVRAIIKAERLRVPDRIMPIIRKYEEEMQI